jgi:putative hydrolase of the HAD superfamily
MDRKQDSPRISRKRYKSGLLERFLMIRTIISDLGNVLLGFDHMQACRELAELCQWSPEQIYDSMFHSDLVRDYDLGRISSVEFGRRTIERLGLNLGVEVIRDIWSDIFQPVEGMEELIRFLRGTYSLVLLSNTNEWHFEHCHKRFPVVRLFEHYALSYRLGYQKPDPMAYQAALSMAGALPAESFYVDDLPAYVESGKRLGMKGVCFRDVDQLKEEMRSAGIPCP